MSNRVVINNHYVDTIIEDEGHLEELVYPGVNVLVTDSSGDDLFGVVLRNEDGTWVLRVHKRDNMACFWHIEHDIVVWSPAAIGTPNWQELNGQKAAES